MSPGRVSRPPLSAVCCAGRGRCGGRPGDAARPARRLGGRGDRRAAGGAPAPAISPARHSTQLVQCIRRSSCRRCACSRASYGPSGPLLPPVQHASLAGTACQVGQTHLVACQVGRAWPHGMLAPSRLTPRLPHRSGSSRTSSGSTSTTGASCGAGTRHSWPRLAPVAPNYVHQTLCLLGKQRLPPFSFQLPPLRLARRRAQYVHPAATPRRDITVGTVGATLRRVQLVQHCVVYSCAQSCTVGVMLTTAPSLISQKAARSARGPKRVRAPSMLGCGRPCEDRRVWQTVKQRPNNVRVHANYSM
jgi:hypothetical protein